MSGYSLAVIRLPGATEDVSPANPLLPVCVAYVLGRAGHVIIALDFGSAVLSPQGDAGASTVIDAVGTPTVAVPAPVRISAGGI